MTTPRTLSAYVESWGRLFEREGLPRTPGRIWGWLLVCDPPEQGTGALCEALHLTKGSISTSTRLLEKAGLLERRGVPGSRQIHYRVRPDACERLMDHRLESIGLWSAQAEKGLKLVGPGATELARRLRELHELYSFIARGQTALRRRWHRRRAAALR
jgi:DNA-binding MarR family transcriptional regulator